MHPYLPPKVLDLGIVIRSSLHREVAKHVEQVSGPLLCQKMSSGLLLISRDRPFGTEHGYSRLCERVTTYRYTRQQFKRPAVTQKHWMACSC